MKARCVFYLFLVAGLLAGLWLAPASAQRNPPVDPGNRANFSDLPRPAIGGGRAILAWPVVGFFPAYDNAPIGVDYAPPYDYAVLAHESSPNPTIYDVDYTSHALLGSLTFSTLNPGWPQTLDNRDGVEYSPETDTFFASDYEGDQSTHDDNIAEYTPGGVILNAWETDDYVGSNDSYDGSAIGGIVDIAVAPGPRYFVAATGDGSVVYEIDLIKAGWWVPNTWGTITTWPLSGLSDNVGISYDADHGVLYHSDYLSDTIVVTDLSGSALETFSCPGAGGFNSGVAYVEGKAHREVWVTDLESNIVTMCRDIVIPPCEWQTVWSEDFENGYGNWSMDGLWNPENEADACGSLVAPFPSSTNGAYYGIDGQCTYNSGAANSGSLAMQVDASLAGAVDAEVSFWSYEQTECGGDCAYDNRYLDLSTDGGEIWVAVGEGNTENAWYNRTVAIPGAADGPARLRFRFDTVDPWGNDYFGWMVDNVEVRGCFPLQEHTMHIANITGGLTLDPYGRTLAFWHVLTHDQDHAPLSVVTVDASIWDPIGGPYARTRLTKSAGWARFHWGRNQVGSFRLCVDNLTKSGYTYDPYSNDLPNCAQWSN